MNQIFIKKMKFKSANTLIIVGMIGLFILFTVGILAKRKFNGSIKYSSFKIVITTEN